MKMVSKYIKIMLILLIVITVVTSYLLYQNYNLKKENLSLVGRLSSKSLKLDEIIKLLSSVQSNFTNVKNEKNKLKENLNKEIVKMTSLQKKIGNITGVVGTLEKLSKTDKELLQKYSKVYFLNENYVPSKLKQIDSKYTYDKNMDKWIHASVYPYLERMINDATNDGVDLLVKSAYRSFQTQARLKSRYSVVYGSGANKFSADQGYSEHQLGTTVDLTTLKIGDNFSLFKNSDSYKWLLKNAYRYGFVLSYPKGNDYYIFESWHWRFVGVKLASMLHKKGISFYNLDQREIDKYLVDIFD